MKWLLAVIVAGAAAWSGVWAVSAWQTRGAVEGWFEDRRADGWQADFSALKLRGYPNRVDVTLEGVALADPETGLGWEAPFFQILKLTYRPGHQILVFPDTHHLITTQAHYALEGSGMRASLVHNAAGRIARANFEAEALNVTGPTGSRAFASVTAAALVDEAVPERYRVGISAATAASNAERVDGLSIDAEILFDSAWQISALQDGRPQPRAIDLRVAEYRAARLELKLAGALEIAPDGQADGQLVLRAENWREKLSEARDSGALPEGVAGFLEQGLSLMASLRGNPASLDLPLDFKAGRVWVGLIPLGPQPTLQLP